MFTGIIESIGKITSIQNCGEDFRIEIESGDLDLGDVKLGDSIATNGVCLTVIALSNNGFSADVSSETIEKTGFTHYQQGTIVNLEKALLPTTRLGGHIVSGHVDGVAKVKAIQNVGRAVEYWITPPADLIKYIVQKGSVTIDGISLTVNDVDSDSFKLTIVPHTSQETTITNFKVGTSVNLEIDILARYIENLLLKSNPDKPKSNVSFDLLAKSGFIK